MPESMTGSASLIGRRSISTCRLQDKVDGAGAGCGEAFSGAKWDNLPWKTFEGWYLLCSAQRGHFAAMGWPGRVSTGAGLSPPQPLHRITKGARRRTSLEHGKSIGE